MKLTYCLVVFCVVLAGCTIKRPLMMSSASMGPGQEEVVGMATGKSSAFYFLGILVGQGDNSLKSAVEDALTNTRAHTMVNTFADESCTFFPFFASCEVRVTGTAIRYKDLKENSYFEAMGKLSPDSYRASASSGAAVSLSSGTVENAAADGARLFADFCAKEPSEARKYCKSMQDPESSQLKSFVLSKGKLPTWGWRFVISKDLPPYQRGCVALYVKGCTEFDPVLP